MEIAFHKAEFPCLAAAVNEVQNSEQTQELRLPDGMPDVGKVLCAWGQTILRGKEWRSDSLTVSGGMLMWVLYAPEDGSECRIVDGWLPFQMRWQLPPELPEGGQPGGTSAETSTDFSLSTGGNRFSQVGPAETDTQS